MRPYVLINSAVSKNFKLAKADRKQLRISNEEDLKEVDKIRAKVDAILVGSTTLKNDDPSLTLKHEKGKNPIKVAISKDCNIKEDSDFLKGDEEKIIFTTRIASPEDINRIKKHAAVIQHRERVDINELLGELGKKGIKRLLVEGGGKTNYEFIKADAVDEIRVAISQIEINEKDAPNFIEGEWKDRFTFVSEKPLGDMTIKQYKNDDRYMRLALEEAKKCTPSKKYFSVGAILEKSGEIIGTGHTREHENDHAEETAISKTKNPVGSTLYTTMEPCTKRKSKTSCCVESIQKAKIARVVFAAKEPDTFVKCEGEEFLKKNGISVTQLKKFEQEALEMNKHILTALHKN
ncbi:hypothetical protein GOV09_01905 [Candidatus Woesearchaeota archaeon]|nr:hypothetical protein [Candidatus Woesearchaeota archaeon]